MGRKVRFIMKRSEIKTAIGYAINNCSNQASLEDMLKLESFETVDLTEKLSQKKQEVESLEKLIAEAEECKAKQEAQEAAKRKAEEMFFGTLTASGKEVMAYLEGLQTLAKGEQLTLVKNIVALFKSYSKGIELSLTANLSAYVSILVKEEQKEVINLLESITLKVDAIQCASSVNEERVVGLLNILLAVQDIY